MAALSTGVATMSSLECTRHKLPNWKSL